MVAFSRSLYERGSDSSAFTALVEAFGFAVVRDSARRPS